MHLLVGRENDCSGSNIPQKGVFQDWLPHSPLVVWNDVYKDHIEFIYHFNLLPLSYYVSEYKWNVSFFTKILCITNVSL